jgi:hypothetical protein
VAGEAQRDIKLTLEQVASVRGRERLFQTFNDDRNVRMEFIPYENAPNRRSAANNPR